MRKLKLRARFLSSEIAPEVDEDIDDAETLANFVTAAVILSLRFPLFVQGSAKPPSHGRSDQQIALILHYAW